ncbi:hypothetical protein [Burkholderia paludis]|uniref:hypothetical protein n=1 Tax=Burkholderia paludis TaxID=1506587 RepID=UPI001269C0D4|nr:hypothetical protein [Burkholderia paludis]
MRVEALGVCENASFSDKWADFLWGGFVSRESEIIVNNAENAEIFACDQDVDVIKGGGYRYWIHILEGNARTVEGVNLEDDLGLGGKFYQIGSDVFDGEVMPDIISRGRGLVFWNKLSM